MVPFLLLALCSAPSAGWSPLPLVSREQRAAGFSGGEGGQWPRSIACDASGRFLILSIDVGGLYRSMDGGLTWEPCNVGYHPRGSAFCAIDPKNPNRAISVGVNSSPISQNGLYLTEDRAASWRSVLPVEMGGDEHREQVVYDPSSYDSVRKETRRLFWSRIATDKPSWGPARNLSALFQSLDGGRTWSEVKGQEALGGKILRFHPKGSFLYAGGEDGLWKVNPKSFVKEKVLEGLITGLDVSPKDPSSLWVSTPTDLMVSHDHAKSWKALPLDGIPIQGRTLRGVKVSPASPLKISLWSDESPNGWNWPRFVSHDGGKSWKESAKSAKGAFLPDNTRQGFTLWHPVNPAIAWSYGGDWPTRSTDGGLTFAYSGQGVNALMAGGLWSFSKSNPDLIFVGSQDYNGAVTLDGGRTWRYVNPSGNAWGGLHLWGICAQPTDFDRRQCRRMGRPQEAENFPRWREDLEGSFSDEHGA